MKLIRNQALRGIALGLLLCGAWELGFAKTEQASDSIEDFRISDEPAPKDWRRFIGMKPDQRIALWAYQEKAGRTWSNWAWGWRLGWVRVCNPKGSSEHAKLCARIFAHALQDKALVVRAEAATKLGVLYEGTSNEDALEKLVRAYRDERNRRNGKPMFIQQRILFAIKKIGGSKAATIGAQLASKDQASEQYWRKINRM